MPKKIYVLDTSVLISGGREALTGFGKNTVVIPFVAIEELEKKRADEGLEGTMARYVLQEIERIRSEKGKLKDGVIVNTLGGILKIEMNHRNPSTLPEIFADDKSKDTRVLSVANNLYLEEMEKKDKGEPYQEVILLSNNLPLRIKADATLAMDIQPFWFGGHLYSGLSSVAVNDDVIDEVYSKKKTEFPGPASLVAEARDAKNHAFELTSLSNPSKKALVYYNDGMIRQANPNVTAIGGVKGRSVEQKIALDYLFDDSKKIVSLGGKAGTGKTLLSVVAAIDQTVKVDKNKQNKFSKITVIRPIYAVGGQDMGHLPGGEQEKMDPWKSAIFDSMENVVPKNVIDSLHNNDKFNVIPATYLRGKTFNDGFIIVDEAQNFEPLVLLTIISRLGEDSKIVLLWDATQKDNDSIGYNDGIVSVVDKLKHHDLFAHISLVKSERSKVAKIAASILEDYIK